MRTGRRAWVGLWFGILVVAGLAAGPLGVAAREGTGLVQVDSLIFPGEKHFKHLWQLTFDGENAEAYWSPDGRYLIFQRTPRGGGCDQIYILDTETGESHLVSTGKGRTTCAYFLEGGRKILYSSTHLASEECPPPPDRSLGYVWALYDSYEIFVADRDGSNPVNITNSPGYDAEATVSPDGKRIVFTSTRSGDPEIYTMDPDGSNVVRLTFAEGYDGGPFFSHDGTMICFRASRPRTEEEKAAYRDLIEKGLIRPGRLELFVMNADGSNLRQITDNGAANFCPFFFPDDRRIIFSSNLGNPQGHNFDLYAIGIDGKGLERITTYEGFDGFPMFSPDGKKLVFGSNRGNELPRETNIFIAEWVD
jgi:Tol biopolymer transport system component